MFIRKDLKELYTIWNERKDYVMNLKDIEKGGYITVWQMLYSGTSSTSVQSSFKGIKIYVGQVVRKTRKSFVLKVEKMLYVYHQDELNNDLHFLPYPNERLFYFDSDRTPIKVFKD